MTGSLGNGVFSNAFKANGIYTFEDACEWVRHLAYRRNVDHSNPLKVIHELCGTCSSKHELIKRLAEENETENCKLILCMFKMNVTNTPEIVSVLSKYKIEYIPEAHTYIILDGQIQDYTFPEKPEMRYLKDVIYTKEISADQIRTYKSETHKNFIKNWIETENVSFTYDKVWAIREACIGALSV